MRKKMLLLLSLSCLLAVSSPVTAEEAAPASPAESIAAEAPSEAAPLKDNLVTTEHSAMIRGEVMNYTATAGTMALTTNESACEIFFTAYTLPDAGNAADRPVTFVFNGGPGSASLWMHMGFFGPRRIAFDKQGQASKLPLPVVDNDYTILDLTDLVFIDPVGTGYSKPADGVDIANFLGYENDNRTVGDFIRLYISRYGRWSSPKYLAGESYGTVRAIGVCKYLSETCALDLNGIMLVSSINNYSIALDEGNSNDYAYALYLPTYAADAWYHNTLAPEYQSMDLESFLEEVRSFAGSDYLGALFKGRSLGADEKERIAERIAAYTSLDKQVVLENNIRVPYETFCAKLLGDEKLVIGRIDGRYTGPLTSGSMGDGASDPSNFSLDGIFGAAFNAYIADELDYHTDREYVELSLSVNEAWEFPHSATTGFTQEQIIYEAMSKNRFLKLWVLCGYYDMATPFYAAEWTYDHVFLQDEALKNLQFTYYPSGHMIYMHEPSLAKFRGEAEVWYGGE